MFRTRRFAPLSALLAILFVAPSAQASIWDDIIDIGEGIVDDVIDIGEGIIDVGEEVCDLTPWIPACLVLPIIEPIVCINPPCDGIDPNPNPEPWYRYYAATNGTAKTKVKQAGYHKGQYAWMIEYDGNGFVAYDTYGYEYTGSAFPVGTKPGKYQLQLDEDSLAYFSQYLSERASDAAGKLVTVALSELPVITVKEMQDGYAKIKIKARGQAATGDGAYATKYKCKMTGERGDKLDVEILPLPLEELPTL